MIREREDMGGRAKNDLGGEEGGGRGRRKRRKRRRKRQLGCDFGNREES